MTRTEAALRLLEELEGTVSARALWRVGAVGFPHVASVTVATRFVVRLRTLRQRILSLFAEEPDRTEIPLRPRRRTGKASRMRPAIGGTG